MENTENTTDSTSTDEAAPEAPAPTTAEAESTSEASETAEPETPAAPADDGTLGKLTPEEQSAMLGIRQQSQQLLAKIGEYELLKQRLLNRLNELDEQGQQYINAVSQRLGIKDGQQWVALQDGTIRLVNNSGGTSG